jgi:hypothetical protein
MDMDTNTNSHVNVHMTINMNVNVKPESFNYFLHRANKQHLLHLMSQQKSFQLENDIFYYLNYLKTYRINFKKPIVIEIAKKYGIIECGNFKNKESLLDAIIRLWIIHFIENPQFKKEYEIYHKCNIIFISTYSLLSS